MATIVKKYNPGFLTDDQIVESFCVRTSEFESIIESLRDLSANSNSHSLVVGPRGSGKTHLLRRVAAELRRDAELKGLFPIVFAEESYEVTTRRRILAGVSGSPCRAGTRRRARQPEPDSRGTEIRAGRPDPG